MPENNAVIRQTPEAVANAVKNRPEISTQILDRITFFAQRLEAASESDKERYLPMLTDAVDQYIALAVGRGSDKATAMKTVGAILRRQMPNMSQEILREKFNEQPQPPVVPESSFATAAPQPPILESAQPLEVIKKEQEKQPGEVVVSEFFYNGYLGPESHQSTMFVALNQGERPSLKAYEVVRYNSGGKRMEMVSVADGVIFSFLVNVDSDGKGTRPVNERLAIKLKNVDPNSLANWGEELSGIVFKLIEERDGRQKLLDKKNLVEVLSGELLNLQQKMRQKTPTIESSQS